MNELNKIVDAWQTVANYRNIDVEAFINDILNNKYSIQDVSFNEVKRFSTDNFQVWVEIFNQELDGVVKVLLESWNDSWIFKIYYIEDCYFSADYYQIKDRKVIKKIEYFCTKHKHGKDND